MPNALALKCSGNVLMECMLIKLPHHTKLQSELEI